MEAIHIWNLEDIQLKMTKLEWPQQRTDRRMDRQTDGRTGKPKTIELRQLVGGALKKLKSGH